MCYELPLSSKREDISAWRRAGPSADLEYLAGFFDGDGCVTTQSCLSGCSLQISQSVAGQDVLLLFFRAFGGCIMLETSGKGCTRPRLQWRIVGQAAMEVAKLLCRHCIVKQQQLNVVLMWPGNKLERLRCKSRLSKLKSKPLSAVEDSLLSWSYVTGFFDAEGCIKISAISKSAILDFTQKDPAVLLAIMSFLQSQMTSLSHVPFSNDATCHKLRVGSSSAVIQILQQLLAHNLLVKRETASLVLACMLSSASHPQLRAAGSTNKGNQGRYTRLDVEGCARAKQISALQGQLRSVLAKQGACVLAQTLQLKLAMMQLEHKISSTQCQIQQLRRDVMSIQRMTIEDSKLNGSIQSGTCMPETDQAEVLLQTGGGSITPFVHYHGAKAAPRL